MKNSKNLYLPKMKSFSNYDKDKLLSYGKETFIDINTTTQDPIVSNNIVTAEFDSTETLADPDTSK